jgi:hypothetical protein
MGLRRIRGFSFHPIPSEVFHVPGSFMSEQSVITITHMALFITGNACCNLMIWSSTNSLHTLCTREFCSSCKVIIGAARDHRLYIELFIEETNESDRRWKQGRVIRDGRSPSETNNCVTHAEGRGFDTGAKKKHGFRFHQNRGFGSRHLHSTNCRAQHSLHGSTSF